MKKLIFDYQIGDFKTEEYIVAVSYKKLWKLLIDRDMTKTQLRKESGISTGALAKLGKNENVNTEILVKICNTLHCDLPDIMELTEEGADK